MEQVQRWRSALCSRQNLSSRGTGAGCQCWVVKLSPEGSMGCSVTTAFFGRVKTQKNSNSPTGNSHLGYCAMSSGSFRPTSRQRPQGRTHTHVVIFKHIPTSAAIRSSDLHQITLFETLRSLLAGCIHPLLAVLLAGSSPLATSCALWHGYIPTTMLECCSDHQPACMEGAHTGRVKL